MSLSSTEMRHIIFKANVSRLTSMAYRAIHVLGNAPSKIAMIAIDADDPTWRELLDHLMPNGDWQQYRDRNEMPIGRGSVTREVLEFVAEVCPVLKDALLVPPPEEYLYALVLAGGGASVYAVPYTNQVIEA